MNKEKPKTPYERFMEQIRAAKKESGRAWYEMLEAKFAKPESHKTH